MGRTLKEAQDFVEMLSQSDTGLGGYLQMNPLVKQGLAYYFLQFADSAEWVRSLDELQANDKKGKQ